MTVFLNQFEIKYAVAKKGNSSIIRLGYNLFWRQKKASFFIIFRFKYLVILLKKELNKHFFIFISLNYVITSFVITISTFNHVSSNVKKIQNIIFLSNNYSCRNLLKTSFIRLKDTYNKLHSIFNKFYTAKFIFQFCCLIRLYLFIKLYKKIKNNFGLYYKFSNYLFFLTTTNKLNNYTLKFYFNKLLMFQIKKKKKFYEFILLKTLILKKLELILETLLFVFYKINLKSYFNNVLNTINSSFMFKYSFSYLQRASKKEIIFQYIIFYLKSATLLGKYIGFTLLKNKYHLKNVRYYLNNIYKLYLKNVINFRGVKLGLNGKLNGKMRRQKYLYKIGKVLLNTFFSKSQFYFMPLYTRYGVFSIKTWLSY